jgi:hypothetical protein
MYRRRLAAFAGAIGLLGGLFSSGVAARADTLLVDSTMSSLISTYLNSSQDACVGGTPTPVGSTTTCMISETTPGEKHIAVCVQSNSAGPNQVCSITQNNAAQNNYALVIQHIEQSQGATQPAQQSVSIKQTNDSGSNFSRVFQTINQSTHDQDNGNQSQTNIQHVEATPFMSDGPGLSQMSGTGSNFAEVTQDSTQSGKNAPVATQTAEQFAGNSGTLSVTLTGNGIDQSAPLGKNVAALFHTQQQQLDNSTSQTQTASQDGDITQNGSPGTNLASGTQFQDQQENGPPGAEQHQTGQPKCCSVQNGGQFDITIKTNQFGNQITPAHQNEDLQGNCDSFPNGTCNVLLSATQQGQTTSTTCTGTTCRPFITCVEGVRPCFVSSGGG